MHAHWPDRNSWISQIAAVPVIPVPLRRVALRMAGHGIARTARVYPGTVVLGRSLSLGQGAFVNRGCLIDASRPVRIGDQAHIATGAQILTMSHQIGDHERRCGDSIGLAVDIGEGAWIGAGAIVLPGVTIGAGTVVGAGSVVTDDLPADVVAVGTPARATRDLP